MASLTISQNSYAFLNAKDIFCQLILKIISICLQSLSLYQDNRASVSIEQGIVNSTLLTTLIFNYALDRIVNVPSKRYE